MFEGVKFGCSTTENLAVKIWTSMASLMTQFPDVELHKVKVHETDKNVVTYRGETTEWLVTYWHRWQILLLILLHPLQHSDNMEFTLWSL